MRVAIKLPASSNLNASRVFPVVIRLTVYRKIQVDTDSAKNNID